MKKRIFSLIMAVMTAVLMIMTAAGAEDDSTPDSAGYYYV